MEVTLINYPVIPGDEIAGMAAALCVNGENTVRSLNHALNSGHNSVAEHATYTFIVEGVSRALLAQLTRHRIASFSVMSQRYVSMADDFDYVIPPRIEALGSGALEDYNRQMRLIHDWYCQWQELLKKAGHKSEEANEDARFVLPNAASTDLMVTMNARELMHFFELRCCNRAQWEIRQMADLMLKNCRIAAPEAFRHAGAACQQGRSCPEGKRSCGKPLEVLE